MSKHIFAHWREIVHGHHTGARPERDPQTLSCVEEICRAYSGEAELSSGLSVVYRASPKVYKGEIRLRISFWFTAHGRDGRSTYVEKCVHNCVDDYCHNYPTDELRAALLAALAAQQRPPTNPPTILYRKLVDVEWR